MWRWRTSFQMEVGRVRARLKRATDGVVIQGWIMGEAQAGFLIHSTTCEEILPGDPFVCEVYSFKWTVTCLAVARFITSAQPGEDGTRELTVALERVQTVTVSRGQGNERVLAQGLTAAIWGSSGTMANGCNVRDISRRGLAVEAPDLIEPNTEVSVVVDGVGESITLACIVRYFKPIRAGFRIGLEVSTQDRVSAAKWSQIVAESQATMRQAA